MVWLTKRRNALHGDRDVGRSGSHNDDGSVFLDVERSGVQVPEDTLAREDRCEIGRQSRKRHSKETVTYCAWPYPTHRR